MLLAGLVLVASPALAQGQRPTMPGRPGDGERPQRSERASDVPSVEGVSIATGLDWATGEGMNAVLATIPEDAALVLIGTAIARSPEPVQVAAAITEHLHRERPVGAIGLQIGFGYGLAFDEALRAGRPAREVVEAGFPVVNRMKAYDALVEFVREQDAGAPVRLFGTEPQFNFPPDVRALVTRRIAEGLPPEVDNDRRSDFVRAIDALMLEANANTPGREAHITLLNESHALLEKHAKAGAASAASRRALRLVNRLVEREEIIQSIGKIPRDAPRGAMARTRQQMIARSRASAVIDHLEEARREGDAPVVVWGAATTSARSLEGATMHGRPLPMSEAPIPSLLADRVDGAIATLAIAAHRGAVGVPNLGDERAVTPSRAHWMEGLALAAEEGVRGDAEAPPGVFLDLRAGEDAGAGPFAGPLESRVLVLAPFGVVMDWRAAFDGVVIVRRVTPASVYPVSGE